MKLISFIFCLILLGSCNSTQKKNSTLGSDCSPSKKDQKSAIDIKAINKQMLGIWFAKGDSVVASFEIRQDSIYYPDEFKTYKYTLTKDDTLVVYFEGFLSKSKVFINKDTLILKGDDTDYFIKSK